MIAMTNMEWHVFCIIFWWFVVGGGCGAMLNAFLAEEMSVSFPRWKRWLIWLGVFCSGFLGAVVLVVAFLCGAGYYFVQWIVSWMKPGAKARIKRYFTES